MRRLLRSTCSSAGARWLAVAAAALAFGAALPAAAQPCCGGSAAVAPARLRLHDDELAGGRFVVTSTLGSFREDGSYWPLSQAGSEIVLEEETFAAVRVAERLELSVLVPVVETVRRAHGEREAGGGLGDIGVGARYEFHRAGASLIWPGVSLSLGVRMPTGVPPDAASQPLATDATGAGTLQATLALELEQTYGPIYLSLTGAVARRTPRSVRSIEEALGTEWTGSFAVAYTFESEQSLALVASCAAEGDATIDGESAAGTGRRKATLALAAAWPIDDAWRLQGSVAIAPPIPRLAKNTTATEALSFAVVWSGH